MAAKKKKKSESLIPAVGYLRKSTKGKGKQEKSIPQQKAEISKLAEGRFEIVQWFVDEGVSGWKRGAKRPDFNRMLSTVEELGVQAILCDNLDRFSRAEMDEVQEDSFMLRKAGVRWIVTASHGEYDLGKRNDIGEKIKFIAAVWGAHEFSRNLSRRVTLAKRNSAAEGKRSGGYPAYGYKNVGRNEPWKFGDRKQVQLVRWVFNQFADQLWSMNRIANDLNVRRVPAPRGASWSVKTIGQMLRRRVYIGEYQYNVKPQGQFHRIDESGDVVESDEADGGKVYTEKNWCKPIVDKALFNRAQRRLDDMASQRHPARKTWYCLSGILVCGHCGKPMHGLKPNGNDTVVYRCSGNPGVKADCGNRQVRQDVILPFILEMLSKEIEDVRKLLSNPPRLPKSIRPAGSIGKERDRLTRLIEIKTDQLFEIEDKRIRQDLQQKLTALHNQREQLETDLNEPSPSFNREDLEALDTWWKQFNSAAVLMPTNGKLLPRDKDLTVVEGLAALRWINYEHAVARIKNPGLVAVDPVVVNSHLQQLGAEVKLWWKTQEYKTSGGHPRRKHVVTRGHFRLGQRKGKIPPQYLVGTSPCRSRRPAAEDRGGRSYDTQCSVLPPARTATADRPAERCRS